MLVAAQVPGAARASAQPRNGPTFWFDSYRALLRWQLASLRLLLPVMFAVQILAGVGFVLGFGLFFPGPVPPRSALYISTGVTVINLYILGLVICPQIVGQQKMAKTYEYTQSMPPPRAVVFLVWYSLNLLVGVPALMVSLIAAAWRYGQSFTVSPSVIVAVLLISLCSVAIGFALGNAVSQPMVTQVATQVMNFFAIGFAPVCVPAEQLPGWLQTLNHFLPFESMAVAMRAALTTGVNENVAAAYAVLVAWTLLCLAIAGWSVVKRG